MAYLGSSKRAFVRPPVRYPTDKLTGGWKSFQTQVPGGSASQAVSHRSNPSDYTFRAPGLRLAPGGPGAPTLVSHAATVPKALTNYQPGPVGFLQWLLVAHPQLFAHLKSQAPHLLTQAAAITAHLKQQSVPTCPGLSGLGATTSWASDIGNWASEASQVVEGGLGVYAAYKAATTSPQVQQQIANAAAGQQPYSYPTSSGSTVSTTAPPSSAVTTTSSFLSGSTGIMILGGVGIVGVIAFFGLRKKKR